MKVSGSGNYDTPCSALTGDNQCFGEVELLVFVVQWDLVCDRAYLKDLTQTSYVVGFMVSVLIFSILSDKFGRKPLFLFCQWALVVVGVANAFAPNYLVFTVLRFFSGMLQQVRTAANLSLFSRFLIALPM